MPRYEVKAHWRKPNGDWVGVVGHVPDDYELWYYIEDQDSDADDWTDEGLHPPMNFSECESKCSELNSAIKPLDTSRLLSIPAVMQRIR